MVLYELIGGNTFPICNGDGYKFHPAGREDIDVRMLCSSRLFLIEVQNARHIPSDVSIKEMEKKINSLESNLVSYAKTG
nr:putative tRNA pseudouridine synthase Pus10 [Tanacetum cinerariifolium]